MWVTLIATAIAASICLSVVNLTSEINKVRNARQSPGVEITAQRNTFPRDQSMGTPTISAQKNPKYFDRGA
jgi:hypothetical protein